MPRIYISYRDKTGKPTGGGDPLDFCRQCWPPEVHEIKAEHLSNECESFTDPQIQEDIDEQVDGCDGADHPPYAECEYDCAICGEHLTEEDD